MILYVAKIPLVPVGKTTVTIALLLYMILLFTILFAVARSMRRGVIEKLLERSKLEKNIQSFCGMLLEYGFILIGSVIILNTAGIEMTALTVVAGALGLGLSLGLQTLAKNVAGGMMLLIERKIKIGDRIQIGTTTGNVRSIALRSTTILTDENIEIIVPNTDFMEQRVSNWSLSTREVIVSLPVVVSVENDLSQVKQLIKEAVDANPMVMKEPLPEILIDGFDAGKFKFNVRVATDNYVAAATNKLRSDIYDDLLRRFKEAQVRLDTQAK